MPMFVGGKLEVLGGKMKHPAKVTLVNVQCINGTWRNLYNFIPFLPAINNEMTRFKM